MRLNKVLLSTPQNSGVDCKKEGGKLVADYEHPLVK